MWGKSRDWSRKPRKEETKLFSTYHRNEPLESNAKASSSNHQSLEKKKKTDEEHRNRKERRGKRENRDKKFFGRAVGRRSLGRRVKIEMEGVWTTPASCGASKSTWKEMFYQGWCITRAIVEFSPRIYILVFLQILMAPAILILK